MQQAKLKRSLGLTDLLFFGLGTMVGAGFYALLGEVVREAGVLAPLALLLSGFIALITSFTFAELSSRFPVSAGEAKYINEGFQLPWLSRLTGWLVVLTGTVSSATLCIATVRFISDLVFIPELFGIALVVVCLGAVAAWGVSESVTIVAIITLIEVGALLIIFFLNIDGIYQLPAVWERTSEEKLWSDFSGIFPAALLAFYASVGFEDMVNMAEEVKLPHKNLARAIPLAVGITTLLYLAVSLVAIGTLTSIDLMIESKTPLSVLLGDYGKVGALGIGAVSILSGINGALVQIVMASRVSYGLAKQKQAPQLLAYVHPRTQTPLIATVLITIFVLVLALLLPMTALAKLTSVIILVVFSLANISLWKIKKCNPDPDGLGPRYPIWVPQLGLLLCLLLMAGQFF